MSIAIDKYIGNTLAEVIGWRLRSSRLADHVFGGPDAQKHYPPDLQLEPIHKDIELDIALSQHYLDAKVTITIKANRTDARSITLNGIDFKNVRIQSALKNRSKTDQATADVVEYTYDGKVFKILWDKPFALHEQRLLTLEYRVERPASGLYFMNPTAREPQRPEYAATDHETERAQYWLACIDLPNVRTTLDFKITSDAHHTILANGYLVGETNHKNGRKTAHWHLDQPCPSYLTCFAVGDFVRCDDGKFKEVPISYFACKEFSAADLKRSFGRTGEMLEWITKRLNVDFPYPKYFQFALPEFGGAMENISLVSWSDQFIATEQLAPEWVWLIDQVNIHEMAHSYFGDLVVCRDFANAWLKESWATYIETCWLEDKRGQDEQFYDLYRNAQAYIQEADSRYARPIMTRTYTSSWQMYDRHLYPGGACRLHMLRQELGDQVFWTAVTDYLKRYAFKVVETDDFRKVLEEHSGRSLVQFFEQWIMTPAYPDLEVTFSFDQEKKKGSFEVKQKQVDAKKNIPAFEFSTDVAWYLGEKIITKPITVTKEVQTFTFSMERDPDVVRFDPHWKVLHKLSFNPGDTKLRAQLKQSKDILGRIHAAGQLIENGGRENRLAVQEAYKQESFWGVKREILEALTKSSTQDALHAIVNIIDREQDPLVLPKVFESAAAFQDSDIMQAVTQRLKKAGLGPLAKAAAYRALGQQKEQAPLELLKKAGTTNVPAPAFEQIAALSALGSTRTVEAYTFLKKLVPAGTTHYRARIGAIAGLALSSPYLPKAEKQTAYETLQLLLRDESDYIRLTTAKHLKDTDAVSTIEPLEALRSGLPLQDQVMIDEVLSALKKSGENKQAALEKRIEDLEQKLRKAMSMIEALEQKPSTQVD